MHNVGSPADLDYIASQSVGGNIKNGGQGSVGSSVRFVIGYLKYFTL